MAKIGKLACDCGGEKCRTTHSHWCSSLASLGQFAQVEYQGDTLEMVAVMAGDLLDEAPDTCAGMVWVEEFWSRFGPQAEIGAKGLEWCFNQREMDSGALVEQQIDGRDAWVEGI